MYFLVMVGIGTSIANGRSSSCNLAKIFGLIVYGGLERIRVVSDGGSVSKKSVVVATIVHLGYAYCMRATESDSPGKGSHMTLPSGT